MLITEIGEIIIERLAADREEAIGFLQAVMEDYQVFGNPAAVVSAVQVVIESQGGIAEVAKRAAMDPQPLTKVLSSENLPRVDTLRTILTALGCRLSIELLKAGDCGAERAGVDTSVATIEGTEPGMALATDNK